MESKWSGTAENGFFNGEIFDKHRILKQPEYEYSGRSSAASYYILSVDVGRKDCDSVVCAWKVTPSSTGPAFKSLVNIYTMPNTHFEDQAKKLKKLYYKYKARRLVIDANGLTLVHLKLSELLGTPTGTISSQTSNRGRFNDYLVREQSISD